MHAPHQKRLGLAGLASMNGSRKRGSNAVLRSTRQRRKAYVKAEDALIDEARKRWGKVDNMPPEAQAKLEAKIAHLHQTFFG
ncbi:hypothetical protein B6V75_00685 [Thioclava sp. F1Mire-8]|uniref:hypothetical protein n=1 Tax=Thioclava sp. F1Mire-8 TaxID=1973006 RepID=UPI000B53FCF6|nr:hypothetical protein [Thioclava sp. F1Mire-8]OWY04703.1 hypothetical protein B6V75_00685 [Thioclava sp. F1Mire-8]